METNTCQIPLSRGLFATVDARDYPSLARFKWCVVKPRDKFYAVRRVRKSTGGHTLLYMHRAILDDCYTPCVDHKDGDGLNNTRANLRPATRAQNACNGPKRRGGTSRFRGVYWITQNRKWCAQIVVHRKKQHIGHFKNEVEAAKAYDEAALKCFGEFAYLNFPTVVEIQERG